MVSTWRENIIKALKRVYIYLLFKVSSYGSYCMLIYSFLKECQVKPKFLCVYIQNLKRYDSDMT